MKILVIDSNVVIKWFSPETDTEAADAIRDKHLQDELTLVAPDLLIAEVANILWKKREQVSETQAIDALFQIISSGIEFVQVESLAESAYRLARQHKRSAYDCFYLALAVSHHCDFITADERLFNAIAKQEPRVKLLREYSVE
ncbi:MAG: type II toxin-antitoxin system VapC family toxin [Chloroflexi bacterium]|nr:type II toxin-antitoxin system VapC family toxin [Chloroflexota bacterium]